MYMFAISFVCTADLMTLSLGPLSMQLLVEIFLRFVNSIEHV